MEVPILIFLEGGQAFEIATLILDMITIFLLLLISR